MALVVADRVQETTSTTSTSDYVLLGAAAGYQSFGAVLANADTTYYAITNDTDWEVGLGTYSTTGPTLARTTVLASSNGGSAVSWGVGVKNIFISYAASKASFLDANGDLPVSDKIVHAGDTDTAIRFPAANTMSVETGGTERFKVENSTITTTVPVLLPADPTLPLQAATKEYVDTIASAGIHYHAPVRVESPINLNATYNNGTSGVGATLTNAGTQVALVIDGVTVAVNDRVLIYTQTNQTQNGVYVVTDTGSGSTNWVLTRSTDTDSYGPSDPDALGAGDAFFVQQGATGAGELYVCNTEGTITFGTTNITFTQIAATAVYTAGSGLTLTGTVFANAAPDQTVTLTQGGATTITGTYPNFTITSTDTTYSAGNGIGLAGTTFSVAAGSGLTQDASGLSHADTSSQASVDNTGATFVQDVTLDTFGHVTGLASVTVTPSLIGAPQNDGTGATGTWNISISGNAANVNGTVSVANGGTGATTTGQARTNLDVPSTTGGGASGTWNISISGNAATATTAGTITSQANSATITASTAANGNQIVLRDGNADDYRRYGFAEYFNMSHGVSGATGDTIFYSSTDNYIRKNNATGLRASLNVPTRTGGGASGTWGINITGGSATATNLSTDRTNWSTNGTISAVVGQLAWKNYGNSHTIFDASQGTAPNGAGISNTNSQNAWTGTYPTLMGWNGANTYGVRVDSARVADIAGSVSPPAYGSVGSYAFLVFRGAAFLSAGTDIAGSSLIPGGVYGNTIVADNSVANANGSALSTGSGALGGTWRAFGAVTFSSGSSFSRGTVFLRIS